jgi:hypothetical protein
MSSRELPARPNLEHLKKQARLLLRGSLQAEPAAIDRFAKPRFNCQPPRRNLRTDNM